MTVCALPASFAQSRLWFLDRYEPGSALYNIPLALRLRGELEEAALERTLAELAARHEALRTTFALNEADELVQVIAEEALWDWARVDLSAAGDSQAEALQIMREQARRPFDLARGPLMRAVLLRLGSQEHVLMLTLHHIVTDGWSMGLLVRELAALYAAFCAGRPTPLGELPIQYADFAVWQRERLQGEVLQQQLDYWRRYLQGAPALLDLPTDRPRPPVLTHRGGQVALDFDEELSAGLRRLSRRSQATLFMTLAAAFNVLLHRYCRQNDICVGYPVANRTRTELEGLVGFFANTLVLRSRVDSNISFESLLQQVRDSVLEADAHQDLPFEKLVEELRPQRSLTYSPLFQVMFSLHSTSDSAQLPGLQVEVLEIDTSIAKFDLSLGLLEQNGRLHGAFEYNSDLFDRVTIERMVSHFKELLEAIVAQPHAKLKDLAFLSPAERDQLRRWNDTAAPVPQCGVHQLFEEQVRRTPEAMALVCEADELTYADLNGRANQLAHHLRALGVGPEVLVGLCLERGVDMVIGLLGILKAGGAYVPLDPEYPAERLVYMLQDSAAPIVLTQGALEASLGTFGGRKVFLDRDWSRIEATLLDNPTSLTLPQNLAYCIYTSGSTGRPKGVALTHANAANFLTWARGAFKASGLSKMIFSTSVCFDLSIFELFTPLLVGGRVLLAKDKLAITHQDFAASATAINTVPSVMGWLLDSGWQPHDVRVVNLAGEPLQPSLVERVHLKLPKAAVWNLYGPTEYTTYTTCCPIERRAGVGVSLGRPVSNTRIHILDEDLNALPVGIPGEVHIAGAGLARGYLNRPDLTAEKFIPDPFGEPGGRIYRTGDVGRYLPDGNIEFLGRTDHQVKIRGFRIEPGEIECALLAHDGVREALVLAREDEPGDKRLVAYVVAETPIPCIAQLRAQLQQCMPDYMLPSAYVFLEALPLNANGKVDRKALPAPEASHQALQLDYVGPRNATEELLAGIWAEVLNLDRVGVHDGFFALGGHSLLATQVVTRIQHLLRVEITLRHFFSAPTVAEIAHFATMRAPTALLTQIARRSGNRLPASFAQSRLWFLDQYEPGSALYNIPLALRLRGELEEAALERTLAELAARHEALRTTFALNEADELVQVIAEEALWDWARVDLSAAGDSQAEALQIMREQARRPFDLARGPLMRAVLLRLGSQEHVLMLTLHHIVTDGWSMGLLVRELAALYAAFCAGRPTPLGELPIQYADFAVWQRERLQGEVLQQQLDYWRRYLQGAPALLDLPTDRPRPPVLTHRGGQVALDFDEELSAGLRRLSRRSQATLFMTLAAAFNVLLHRYCRQNDICVGYPVANRTRTELEGLVGFFANTLVLRSRVDSNISFESLLQQVRDSVLEADAHQDLPFEKLVEELRPQRSLTYSPLFQVMFSLHSTSDSAQLPGLQVEVLEIDTSIAKFDLSLGLLEQNGRLHGAFEYNSDLFDRVTIERMVSHFKELLEAIVAQPHAKLKDLAFLSPAERAM